MLATAAGSLAVLFAVVQTPGLSRFFGCRPLDPFSWLVVLGWAAVGTATGEVAPVLIERFRRTRPEEDTMTEQSSTQQQPDDDEDTSRAGGGHDPARPGGGRTVGETTVDDALGQGPPPER